jgi:hypothetical protein
MKKKAVLPRSIGDMETGGKWERGRLSIEL